MSYHIDFVDTTGMARLVAVEDTRHDALVVTEEIIAAVPDAAPHLATVEDPLLGLETRVIQPPANYDTNAGLPVLSLSGVIDPANDWQARVAAAFTDPRSSSSTRVRNPPTSTNIPSPGCRGGASTCA